MSRENAASDSEQAVLTVGDWIVALQPPAPPALVGRLREALSPYLAQPIDRVPDVCLEAGEKLLATLIAVGETSRANALDLLTVDALVTYAFETAARVPHALEARATRALQQIGGLLP